MSICLGYQAVYLDRRSTSFCARLHLLTLALLIVSFTYKVFIKIEEVDLGYRIAEVRKDTVLLDMQRQEMELQYSVATRPDLIEQRARNKLDLMPSEPHQITRISAPEVF
jgi:hypothetical protein